MGRRVVAVGCALLMGLGALVAPRLHPLEPAEDLAAFVGDPAYVRVRTALDGPVVDRGGERFLIVEVDAPAGRPAQEVVVDIAFHPLVSRVESSCGGPDCAVREEDGLRLTSSRMDVAAGSRRTFGLWVATGPVEASFDLADIVVRFVDEGGVDRIVRQTVRAEVASADVADRRLRLDVSRSAVLALAIDELHHSALAMTAAMAPPPTLVTKVLPEPDVADARAQVAWRSHREVAIAYAERAEAWLSALDRVLPGDPSVRALRAESDQWRWSLPRLRPAVPSTMSRIDGLERFIGAR